MDKRYEIEVGKIVVVTGTDSCFDSLLGCLGVVIKMYSEEKWEVKFIKGLRGRGGLSHTVLKSELKVVGEVYYEGFATLI